MSAAGQGAERAPDRGGAPPGSAAPGAPGWGPPDRAAAATLLRVAALEAIPGLVHGISTRATGDLKTAAGRAALAAALGVPVAALVRGRQVHGTEVVCVQAGAGGGAVGDPVRGADALVTAEPGVVLLSLAADCVPLGLVDPERRLAAVVHAGWRGAVRGIAGAAVRALAERFGARPADLLAVIGPAIGPCCYEVGEEVAAAAGGRPGGEEAVWRERSEPQARPRLDLVALVHADLRAAGLPAVRITSLGRCTRCEREQFFSYRGGDARARLGLALGWRPEGGARAKG